MIVTLERYQVITGDADSVGSAVTGMLVDAQESLEEELQRPLEEAERTERMYPDSSGRLYPNVTPIITPPPGVTVDGDTLYATAPFSLPPDFIWEGPWVDFTYTGGYVERSANPDATNRLPSHVERDIAWNAYRLLHPNTALILTPGGLSAVRLGDASMTFKGEGGGIVEAGPKWSPATLRLSRVGRRV